MELELYNGFMAGIGLDGESWFYRNSLRRYEADHVESGHNDMAVRELPGRRRICCPTNLLRTFAQLQSYVYSLSDDGLWIHHYAGNVLNGQLSDGTLLKLTQETDYPWQGQIRLTLNSVERKDPFPIRLRVPGWAEGASLSVNGTSPTEEPIAGTYATLTHRWKSGDVIELRLPMQVRLMQAHPKAEQLRNQVAVMRGPILYCLESVDLPRGSDLNNLYLSADLALTPEPMAGLPFGILALAGTALYRPEQPWEDVLYRPLRNVPLKRLPIRMVPYFAWSNRGPAAMSAWIPLAVNQ